MREQPIGEAVEDDELDLTGVMWPPGTEIEVSEVHASLAKAIAGSRGVRFFATRLIDVPSDCHLGNLQMAIDETAGEACGIYLTTHIADLDAETGEPVLVEEATRPFKFPCTGGVEEAISSLCEKMTLAGVIP
ncbi:hypothetical protein RLEG12_29480 [Rhizobium leguminosarum bv. trifolii CB782]|uniref:Uncharacterized protein n=1 Tax=Rhizobium hidalgonense TaxID=1538159 RepID=A0A2A6KJ51_9HYPH|nr:hypothetical protein [Rhizobium hidalgonense]AHG47131.1 hypothetical protein RLEG12_29480 [Rhizobium leguminosarum bv. trifolii CB782]MDR9773971.1 hypothetical protein [Rhizobium hidalgonense]MDR9810702.1 hypothetical protein [Rhizobium hidalgonense]MDR9819649.1 hypothetical protein [Rhizobium hidalgonense]PDT24445.1 hypothetical protein CO674_07095 [Rhizobium hidalgonense]